jgi:tRNA(Ile)-lysidine synthase
MGLREYKAPMNLQKSIRSVIESHHLILMGSTLVVGVSGGTDSLALLHLLTGLREALDFRLHAATLDHGLRGADGAADAQFVVETAQAWGISVTQGYIDVWTLAQRTGLGIEAAARIARYGFLASVAREVGAAQVAVAHHADDQVETVLLHLLRGSGVSGLAGMAYRDSLPGHPGLTLIRPLLNVTRADLEAYCGEHGLQSRHDASNDDSTYTRNRIRREVLPYLRELSPQLDRRLLQLADLAAVDDDFLETVLGQVVENSVERDGERILLPRAVFTGLHPALQRRFILWAARQFETADDVGYGHTLAAVDVGLNGQVGARALLTGGVQLRLDYNHIVIELEDAPATADNVPLLTSGEQIPVMIPGATPLDAGWTLHTSLTPSETESGRLEIAEGSKVGLRGRREGDRFAPLGLEGHTQKLGKWMIDHKVPQHFRDRLPLVEIDGQIAAIYWEGWKISHHFAVSSAGQRVVYLWFVR